jgi:hypothetical protein
MEFLVPASSYIWKKGSATELKNKKRAEIHKIIGSTSFFIFEK